MRGPEGASVQQCTGATRHPMRLLAEIHHQVASLLGGPRARADIPDLALPDQVAEGLQRFLDRGFWRLTGDAIDAAAASEQAPGCGRTRGRCRESSGNGPGVPSAAPPGSGSGAVQVVVRVPALARVPAWAAVAAGAGVPGAAQAVRVLAVARVPAGAPVAAGVPAAPAMVWAAATAAVPGAAAAALAAVAAAGPAAALLVRGVPVPAMPVPAGWDRRVRRPHELRERRRDLLPPWDTSRPRGNYPHSGRIGAGGVHAGHGGVRFCARRQRGRWRRGARRRPAGPPGW